MILLIQIEHQVGSIHHCMCQLEMIPASAVIYLVRAWNANVTRHHHDQVEQLQARKSAIHAAEL
jgi:hypothetical protein